MLHYEQMVNLIRDTYGNDRDLIGIEIGTNTGRMFSTLLSEFPKLFMFGVDIYNHFPITGNPIDRFTFYNQCSDDAAKQFTNKQVDFIYIDAEHTHEQAKKDILNYAPLVKDDGIIAGHDYVLEPGNQNEGVRFAVDELFESDKIHFGEDLTWWVFRKDVKWLQTS